MKKIIPFLLLFLLALVVSLKAQTNQGLILSTTENISDQDKFVRYVDTIDKYMYHDIKIVEEKISECEAIIQQNTKLSNAILLKYATNKIYHKLNNYELLNCYQIIKDNEHFLADENIPNKVKNNFTYIRGYTQMALGDLASAQKTYYSMLEQGRLAKDTSHMINALYSLGQLLSDEKEYDSAIKHFQEVMTLLVTNTSRPSTRSLCHYELGEAYLRSGQLNKALKIVEKGLAYAEKHNIGRVKPDFLIMRGDIALQQNDLPLAQKYYLEVAELAKNNKDPYTHQSSQLFHAELLISQKRYQTALKIYDDLIENYDTTQLKNQLGTLGEAHIVANKMGNDNKAYQYLLKQSEIANKIKNQEKRQQTAYLKIQFESTQKEKENQALAIKVLQEQNQNRFLYYLLASFFLVSLFLYFAFSQKKKYNQTLQQEVQSRTTELQTSNKLLDKSNKELEEFNRILSHDLKEPLRSIVGFSYLAQKENNRNPQIDEYMRLIEKGGKQLYKMIEDVALYQDIDNHFSKSPQWVKSTNIAKNVIEGIKNNYSIEKVDTVYLNLRPIFITPFILETLFKTILDNSIKFNQNQVPKVSIRYYQAKGNHCFEFKDNGIGIAQEFHQVVFEMFKRLNTRDIYMGSGLGLSTLRKMIEKIKGSIEVLESKPNQGTTFLATFPIIEDLEKPVIAKVRTSPAYA